MDNNLSKVILSISLITSIILIRMLVNRVLLTKVAKPKTHYNLRKGVIYLSNLVLLIGLLALWLDDFRSALTFLGLVSAGLAVALRDPIVNLFGWFHIIFNRPFEVGHRIEIESKKGDVLDINFFEFTLLEIGEYVDANQSTGRIIHIPNSKVFSVPIVNAVQGFQFIWNEIPVLITFQSNWEKAKKILLEIEAQRLENVEVVKAELDEGERRFNVHYNVLTPTVYTSVKPSGILLTLRFLCHPKRQRSAEQLLWEEILKVFAKECDIDFAYQSSSIYLHHPVEGALQNKT